MYSLANLLLEAQAVELLELTVLSEPLGIEDAREIVARVLVVGACAAELAFGGAERVLGFGCVHCCVHGEKHVREARERTYQH